MLRLANVLDKLPKSLQPRVHQALHEVMYAETRVGAEREIGRVAGEYGAKYRTKQGKKAAAGSPSLHNA